MVFIGHGLVWNDKTQKALRLGADITNESDVEYLISKGYEHEGVAEVPASAPKTTKKTTRKGQA